MPKDVISILYPNLANKNSEEITNYFLDNPEEFKRIVFDEYAYIRIVKALPEAHGNAITEYLLNHPKEFQRIVNNEYAYIYIVKASPETHSNAITEHLLKHPQEFQRIVNCTEVVTPQVILRSAFCDEGSPDNC